MKRLLIVVPVYGSYRAFLKGLAAWLSERGWEVHVATNLEGATVEADVAHLHDIEMPRGANPFRLLSASRSVTKLIREIQPTVVHAHFSVGMLCLALASRVKDVRYLGTFQGMRFPLARGVERWIFKYVECFSILRLDQSCVLTADDFDAVPKKIRKKLAIQDGYGFGCDIQHFDPVRFSDLDKSRLRAELGIPKKACVFIFVGRLTAFKGFHLALEAFQQLRQERDDVHFLVVGEVDPQHPLDLSDLNSIEGVHHVGWQDDPAPYLSISNTMVFPSEREGMPVCMMEALSMGVSVVTADTRGCRELVGDEKTGLIVDLCVTCIFEGLKRMVEKPEEGQRYSRRALQMRKHLDRCKFYRVVKNALTMIDEN